MKRCMDNATRKCPDYPDKCTKCGAYREPTNADRIRAMSDEELAEFIHEPFCDKRTHEECTVSYCGVCHQCVLDWLQQPTEETDHEQ